MWQREKGVPQAFSPRRFHSLGGALSRAKGNPEKNLGSLSHRMPSRHEEVSLGGKLYGQVALSGQEFSIPAPASREPLNKPESSAIRLLLPLSLLGFPKALRVSRGLVQKFPSTIHSFLNLRKGKFGKFLKFPLVKFPSIGLALALYSSCFIPESSSKTLQSNIYTIPTDSQQQVIIGGFLGDFLDDVTGTIATGGLEFCNYSSEPYVNVAYGYWRSRRSGWASTGWFRVNQGSCRDVISLPLKSRYYYYATGSNGAVWSGNYTFCAPSNAFTDYHKSDCSTNDRHGFKQIDVGNAIDYTLNLR